MEETEVEGSRRRNVTRSAMASDDKQEQGPETIYDSQQIPPAFLQLIRGAADQIQVLVAFPNELAINARLFEALSVKALHDGVKVRILVPFSKEEQLTAISERFPGIEWRTVSADNVTFGIFDQERILLVEYLGQHDRINEEQQDFTSAFIARNKTTISGVKSIFETLWSYSDMKRKEEKARRRAQVLLDILVHDIRNYNQISRFSIELLAEELRQPRIREAQGTQAIIASALRAVEGSTQLVDTVSKFSKIVSQENVQLRPVDLVKSIIQSLGVVKHAFPKKVLNDRIHVYSVVDKNDDLFAMADEFLDEVFINLISNAVNYTQSEEVPLDITVSDAYEPTGTRITETGQRSRDTPDGEEEEWTEEQQSRRHFWVVKIADRALGITEEKKAKIFTRYLEGARGCGLGMSIVYGLAVERYRGKVKVLNRLEEDYTKGTTVEVWLPKA